MPFLCKYLGIVCTFFYVNLGLIKKLFYFKQVRIFDSEVEMLKVKMRATLESLKPNGQCQRA